MGNITDCQMNFCLQIDLRNLKNFHAKDIVFKKPLSFVNPLHYEINCKVQMQLYKTC